MSSTGRTTIRTRSGEARSPLSIRRLAVAALAFTAMGAGSLAAPVVAHAGPPPAPPVITASGCHVSASGPGYDSLELYVTDLDGGVLAYEKGSASTLTLDYGDYVNASGEPLRAVVDTHLGGAVTVTQALFTPACSLGGAIRVTEHVHGTATPGATFAFGISAAPDAAACATMTADPRGWGTVADGATVDFNVALDQGYCVRQLRFNGDLFDVTTPSYVVPTAAQPLVTVENTSEYDGVHLAPSLAWTKDGATVDASSLFADPHAFSLTMVVRDHDGAVVARSGCGLEVPGIDCADTGIPAGGSVEVSQTGAPAGWKLARTTFDGSDCAGVPVGGSCPLPLVDTFTTPPPTTVPPTTTPPTTVPAPTPPTTAPAPGSHVAASAPAGPTGAGSPPATSDPNAPVTALPRTGTRSLLLAEIGIGLLLLGLALVRVARRPVAPATGPVAADRVP